MEMAQSSGLGLLQPSHNRHRYVVKSLQAPLFIYLRVFILGFSACACLISDLASCKCVFWLTFYLISL